MSYFSSTNLRCPITLAKSDTLGETTELTCLNFLGDCLGLVPPISLTRPFGVAS